LILNVGELSTFKSYGAHHRAVLSFHDIIEPQSGHMMPGKSHVEDILQFISDLTETAENDHLLVHRHMGVLRSTAAMLNRDAHYRGALWP